MKNVVVTGSTRGIGLGLAKAFLAQGCRVMLSGRGMPALNEAVQSLSTPQTAGRIFSQTCDVGDYGQVQALWDAAATQMGGVDIWVNNAGQANTLTDFWELKPEKMQAVVNTNVLGTMYGSKVALQGMIRQGHGALYNMEGFGSRGGRKLKGLTLYGSTKAAVSFLDDSLIEEARDHGVIVGVLSPGMVPTDMLMNQRSGDAADWERTRRIFNILADRVETVTPWLVDKMLNNTRHGAQFAWLTRGKIMRRFLSAPFVKRHVIDEE